ncbi:ABC transporter permease [Streptomyces sp. VNUA24]|uniref:ABC transporter permease n=1 Tax=Streptomyces sp. VNUA24 TaxID=3031131 RepID=UPI0023B7F8A3|nr:ABC transporter permease [Streptomyces sp. VNUA24]WEH12854.1 ABC transporter permease [Streptomyces sp. VNUA24]
MTTSTAAHPRPAGPAGETRARLRRATALISRSPSGTVGCVVLLVFVAVAVAGPWIAPENTNASSSYSTDLLAAPSWRHWLGTDDNGRDVLSRLILGARSSITVGFAAALVSVVIGAAVGITSGLAGGWVDRLLSAVDDFFLVLPFLPLAVVLTSLLSERADDVPGGRLGILVGVIGLTLWAGTSRIIRSQVISVKERQFVERARALGASQWWIARKHVLPHVLPLVLANTALVVSAAILTESALAFLGLGDPLNPSWGSMLDGANESGALTQGAWWYFLPPGVCIVLAVLSFNLVGHAVEEIVNPRLRERR